MRLTVCLSLLVPVALFAVSGQVMTVLPAEGPVDPGARAIAGATAPRGGEPGACVIGTLDTIGGTTYDWMANGPAIRSLVRVRAAGVEGIAAIWMHSVDMSGTTFPDRNIRYNFYDLGAHAWSWIDPDFMASGVGAYTERVGFPRLDADKTTGAAVISAHYATATLAPKVAREIEPGTGVFDYCVGDPTLDDYAWDWVATGNNGYYHLAMMDYNAGAGDELYYSRSQTWCTWDEATMVPDPNLQPLFPDHNIATSKMAGTNDVCITWVKTPGTGYAQDPAYYRNSTDAGTTWSDTIPISFPPAFSPGGDTVPSFHITSLFPMYDMQNRLHFVANVAPFVRDTNWILPVQLWHWCEQNPDTWNLIHIASFPPESLLGPVGYNAVIACRPSLGEDTMGNLFVAWEEFDGTNYEASTNRLRADIWYSHSSDNGVTWAEGTKITDGGERTFRFPCMLDQITDTIMVEYLEDEVAGFVLYNEGPFTNNPIVVQKWANPYVGVAEPRKPVEPALMRISAVPNPFDRSTRLSYEVPYSGSVSLVVCDAAGRSVRTLATGSPGPGRYSALWNGRDDSDMEVAPGVYLYRYAHDGRSLTGKLTLTR